MSEEQTQKSLEPLSYRPKDLSKALGISLNYAYRLIASGELGAIRTGRRILVPKKEAEAWLERQRPAVVSAKG